MQDILDKKVEKIMEWINQFGDPDKSKKNYSK